MSPVGEEDSGKLEKKKKSSQFNDLGGVLQGASLESGL